jgi:primosomal replication protein N
MNRMVLSAQLVERGAVRYTPAGVPALDCKLQHESTLSEDGQARKVSLEIKALAIGAISRPLGAMALGSSGLFAGFLATTRNGRGLLFHITELTPGAATSASSSDSSPTV